MNATAINPCILKKRTLTKSTVAHFSAKASDLQLPVGIFPREVKIDEFIGNGYPLTRHHFDENGSAIYIQQFGSITLTIFKD
jgi:hypothetical protein